MRMRAGRVVRIGFGIGIASLALFIAPSQAAVPTCNEHDSTIVGSEQGGYLQGTDGNDVVVLGPGEDAFYGLAGDDIICGGDGDDYLFGGLGNDKVFGGSGRDHVFSGAGDDTLNGGPGVDELLYGRGVNGVVLDARIGTATTSRGSDTFVEFEDFAGSFGNDKLVGTQRSELIDGLGGADEIHGLGGNDRILAGDDSGSVSAGDGDDTVVVPDAGIVLVSLGGGNDIVFFKGESRGTSVSGGPGTDTLSFRYADHGGYNVSLSGGRVIPRVHQSWAWPISGFENIAGSPGSDRLVGNALGNRLSGQSSNDVLYGNAGADVLDGGDGQDAAYGGPGPDWCSAELRRSC